MSKKITAVVFAAAGAAVSISAFADTGQIGPGTSLNVISTAGDATPTSPDLGCVVLNSSVKIGTSQNVSGAFECRAATSSTPAVIGVGACHSAGQVKAKTYTCTTGNSSQLGCTPSTTSTPTIVTKDGGSFFAAVSTGGSVSATPLGTAACSASTLESEIITVVTGSLS